jgi:hypothetical protein
MAPAAAQAAPADWQSLPYFDYKTHELYLVSDKTWADAKERAPLTSLPAGQDPTWARRRGLVRKPIWVRRCGTKRQTAELSKTISAPGVPSTASIQLDFASHSHSIRSVTVLVNAVSVARVTKAGRVALPAAALKAFKNGLNQITLRAKRAKLRKGFKCNTKNDTAPFRERNAVAFDLLGSFKTDLAVYVTGAGASKMYVQREAGSEVLQPLHSWVINRGPAMSIQGALGVSLTFGSYLTGWAKSVQVGSPFSSCEVTTIEARKHEQWICRYETWSPGAGLKVVIPVRTDLASEDSLPVNYGTTSYRIEWRLLPGPAAWANNVFNSPFYWDPQSNPGGVTPLSTNEGSFTVIYCGPEADDPGCEYATHDGCIDPPPCHDYPVEPAPATSPRRSRAG